MYNESDLVYLGPVVSAVTAGPGNSITVKYSGGTEGGGLKLRSKYGFEVCASGCGDGFAANLQVSGSPAGFAPAVVSESTANTVTIVPPTSLGGKPVLTVRYAFDDSPSQFFTPSTQVRERFLIFAWCSQP